MIKEKSVICPFSCFKLWECIWLSGFTEFIIFMILAFLYLVFLHKQILSSVFLGEFVHVIMNSSGSKPNTNSFSFAQLFVIYSNIYLQTPKGWAMDEIEIEFTANGYYLSASIAAHSRQHSSRDRIWDLKSLAQFNLQAPSCCFYSSFPQYVM